jgi:phage tail sheath protein FI
MRGATPRDGWQYVNVRGSFLCIEESIDHGTQWAVFEPNEEPLSELNTH